MARSLLSANMTGGLRLTGYRRSFSPSTSWQQIQRQSRGFAFSGAPDVAKVEVTDDGGATFHGATLGKEHEPHAWRRFTYAWKAKSPGTTTLAVRATDVRGSVQPKDGVWNPSGYLFSGWHTATIEVTA